MNNKNIDIDIDIDKDKDKDKIIKKQNCPSEEMDALEDISIDIDNRKYKPSIFMGSIIAMFAISTGVNNVVHKNYDVLPDATGSEKQEELLEYHTNSLLELKQQKLTIEKIETNIQIEKEFGTITIKQEQALSEIKNDFITAKNHVLMELQMKGATDKGAGISEQNFDKLYKEALSFLDVNNGKIIETPYSTNIETGMLDEYLTKISPSSDINEDSRKVNESMAKSAHNKDISSVFAATSAGMAGGAATFAMLLLVNKKVSKRNSLQAKIA